MNALSEINSFIKSVIILAIFYIALIIGFAYGGYFVGIVVSLAAGGLFSADGAVLAEVFAWIGVGLAHVTFIAMIIYGFIANSRQVVEISEEELSKIFNDVWKDGDK